MEKPLHAGAFFSRPLKTEREMVIPEFTARLILE
jgi:hypothetical protein